MQDALSVSVLPAEAGLQELVELQREQGLVRVGDDVKP